MACTILMAATVAQGGINCNYESWSIQVAGPDDAPNYGRDVALNFNQLVIGDYVDDSNTGRVLIAEMTLDGEWVIEHTLTGLTPGEEFGKRVAADYDQVAILAESAAGGGVVDIWERDITWGYAGTAVPFIAKAQMLRTGPAIDNNWLAVPEQTPDGIGYVQMWQRAGDGTWGHRQSIAIGTSSSLSVDISHDRMAIGNPEGNSGGVAECGHIHIYVIDPEFDRWEHSTTIIPDDARAGWRAGTRVAINWNLVAYSGGGYGSNGWGNAAVDVWEETSEGWASGETYEFPDGRGEDANVAIWDIDLSSWVLAIAWTNWIGDTNGVKTVMISDGEVRDFYFAGGDEQEASYAVAVSERFVAAEGVAMGSSNRTVWFGPAEDCDLNGADDACDLQENGTDQDSDDELDRCACPGNTNPHVNSEVDAVDVFGLVSLFWGGQNEPVWPEATGDFDGDGACDVRDLLILLENWGSCP